MAAVRPTMRRLSRACQGCTMATDDDSCAVRSPEAPSAGSRQNLRLALDVLGPCHRLQAILVSHSATLRPSFQMVADAGGDDADEAGVGADVDVEVEVQTLVSDAVLSTDSDHAGGSKEDTVVGQDAVPVADGVEVVVGPRGL